MSKKEFTVRPFEKLRKSIERQTTTAAPVRLRQKKKEEYTDDELFRREMDGVEEIVEFRALACAHHRNKEHGPSSLHRDVEQEALSTLVEITEGRQPIHLPDTQEYVEWVNPKHVDDVILRLHEGRFSVQAWLDLHGCTVPEAEEELDAFFRESQRAGLSCVKIIHGRGLRSVKGARIKAAVVKRLSGRFRRKVIAFVTARQCDGGLSALYVLLAKQ